MSHNQTDKLDEEICETLLDVYIAVHSYYKHQVNDCFAKKKAGILVEVTKDNYTLTQKYYNSLCTEKLKILGLTSNNDSFNRIMSFDENRLNEMRSITYDKLKPYVIGYMISNEQYEKAKEVLEMLEGKNEKIAVKSGLYFEIFERKQLPNTIINSGNKVRLNGEIFELYQADNLVDERKIDVCFGEKMGYSIEEHIIERDEECEEAEYE